MKIKNVLVALCLGLVTSLASAQATRTWVSGVGDDANPCSRTAPCKTFAGAISKTAAGGEINAIDPGGFGAVTITKSITIDGGGTLASILASGTNGVIINASANDQVILRNLDINGAGTTPGVHGINLLSAKRLIVENTRIYGFSQNGILVAPTGANVDVLVGNSTIANIVDGPSAAAHGIRVMPGPGVIADVTVSNSLFEGNDKGVMVEDGGQATISRTVVSNSKDAGISAKSTGRATKVMVEASISSGNRIGLLSTSSGATIYVSDSTISRNMIGFDPVGGGALVSFGNNRVIDNQGDYYPTLTTPLK
ncbi:MAG TPA: right-handed parallel beta-helix repeat-containing protein [Rhodocyclaceae bacterium]|nr:right-handed parallel beta-helix repeat-containing protein [Rhodocyclaceae bacterium]HMV53058.1 right-handed parallel beta-helix repeat-containing protein [Rhodocyclaceae bacterium]HMZ83399.1 right-handed parallel beta-helix repeat-containing protein [Rhodocyclaceae bacterium]HNA03511.1 right-handed parallel beta-helix repeat-containing protein [Rhodocyclaceae bacterium]HNB78577.1 right-handed parallel beta-helix repeat-containing protein [Rhodocyclaceae bacterium]